ncbi:MAG: hypothetical protein CMK49_01020 [Prochlorococcus sp. SP3034]|nr:hypothetical protein [Prochlorococcus sp. SP3034]|tara:strand:+ start:20629 stop:21477 length:849 start_codon:yes stop_codon:yes gene_type:complete
MLLNDLLPLDFDYYSYIAENKIDKILKINEIPENPENKVYKSITSSVDPHNVIPFAPELDDLSRLHYIVRDRKVNTILEFGVGKSSAVFANALHLNKISYGEFVKENLRKSNLFEVHSVDNYEKWIEECRSIIQKEYLDQGISNIHFSTLITSEFAGKICTLYENLPNISPDLIYLDGPDQFSAKGEIRGLSTKHQDRFPMSADILSFEHFLHPGTLIIIDGRTANARFLRSNLQRNWSYTYSYDWDQHFFELLEEPLGKYNKAMIDHCLGNKFYNRLNSIH